MENIISFTTKKEKFCGLYFKGKNISGYQLRDKDSTGSHITVPIQERVPSLVLFSRDRHGTSLEQEDVPG